MTRLGMEDSRPGPAARMCILFVQLYQTTLSRFMGGQCRFFPTCSHYAIDAFRTHGAVRGTWLTLRRLLRCHPLGGFGYDPVPPRKSRRDSSQSSIKRNGPQDHA